LVALSDKNERTVDGGPGACTEGEAARDGRNRGTVMTRAGRTARWTSFAGWAPAIAALSIALSACSNAGSEAPDNLSALNDISQHRTHQQVTVEGTVAQLLHPTKTAEGRHERFMLDVHTGSGDEQLILVAHNIDIAPEVPLQNGDDVIVHGELELDPQGPVIHWTHHDPRGRNPPGFIKVRGQTYE
jgi:hypothetical protein